MLALAGLLGGTVGNSLPAFTVDSAAERGIGESAAGVILAVGSATSVLVRLAVGWLADRRRSTGLTELAALMALGLVSFVFLAASEGHDAIYVVAIVAGFAGAWGWQGLIYSAAVHTHPRMSAAATGFILSTIYLGHVFGPMTIGLVAEHSSFTRAWVVACGALALATAAALRARWLGRPEHARSYSPANDPVGS
jgi:predicted MFS family arabinose efflux permease